jgi:hypothetical protein
MKVDEPSTPYHYHNMKSASTLDVDEEDDDEDVLMGGNDHQDQHNLHLAKKNLHVNRSVNGGNDDEKAIDFDDLKKK